MNDSGQKLDGPHKCSLKDDADIKTMGGLNRLFDSLQH